MSRPVIRPRQQLSRHNPKFSQKAMKLSREIWQKLQKRLEKSKDPQNSKKAFLSSIQKILENYKKAWGLNKSHKKLALTQNQENTLGDRLSYPPWATNPFSILIGMTLEEPLTIDSAMRAFSREDSPPWRSELVTHDLEAARTQSTAMPTGSRSKGQGGHQ